MHVAVYFSKYNSYSLSQFDIYINITTLTHSPFLFPFLFCFPFCFHFHSHFPFPSSSSFGYIHCYCYCYCMLRHYQSNTEHITNSNVKSMNHHSAFRSRSASLRKIKHSLNLLFPFLVLLLLFLWLFHYLAKILKCVDVTTLQSKYII